MEINLVIRHIMEMLGNIFSHSDGVVPLLQLVIGLNQLGFVPQGLQIEGATICWVLQEKLNQSISFLGHLIS